MVAKFSRSIGLRRLSRLRGHAYRIAAGSLIISCTDTTGPKELDAPTGIVVTLLSPSAVRVSWSEATEPELIKSYNVFRDGNKLGETTFNFYVDETVAELSTHRYTISANGFSGEVSPIS